MLLPTIPGKDVSKSTSHLGGVPPWQAPNCLTERDQERYDGTWFQMASGTCSFVDWRKLPVCREERVKLSSCTQVTRIAQRVDDNGNLQGCLHSAYLRLHQNQWLSNTRQSSGRKCSLQRIAMAMDSTRQTARTAHDRILRAQIPVMDPGQPGSNGNHQPMRSSVVHHNLKATLPAIFTCH